MLPKEDERNSWNGRVICTVASLCLEIHPIDFDGELEKKAHAQIAGKQMMH